MNQAGPVLFPRALTFSSALGTDDRACNRSPLRTSTKTVTGGSAVSGSTEAVVDTRGCYTEPSVPGLIGAHTPLDPARIVESGVARGGIAGPVGGGATFDVRVAARAGVTSWGVSGVVPDLSVVDAVAAGYLTPFPTGAVRPNPCDLALAPGGTRANLVVVGTGADRRTSLLASAPTRVIFDVAGWFD